MLTREHFSLNTLQWIVVEIPEDHEAHGEIGWEFDRPSFLDRQESVLAGVKNAGFDRVMMEVLRTQTLQAYRRRVDAAGLSVTPGYAQVALPEDFGTELEPGSEQEFRWYDDIRRRAEETLFMGLDRVFISPDMSRGRPRIEEAAAIGLDADAARLDRVANAVGRTAEVLKAEGVTAALHNHVGTWIETEQEYDYVLNAIPSSLMTAGPDLGHLAWTGTDIVAWVSAHADRISDLHIKDIDVAIAEQTRQSRVPYYSHFRQRFFLEPGQGQLPLREALAELPEGFDGTILVEVDKPSQDPYESAKTSWAWVAENYPEGQS
ncbi:sugar phosphate isomerase/epimerase [Microbacterium sp.]|uniref:sugar phosphate isomerase/epimerase family protein n=1 Tax=Microbacterium sp. TaxID=51671 RepID=UPI00263A2CC7|nr:sugar phosphate isomerase/epimerase [Microbacterium sp.]